MKSLGNLTIVITLIVVLPLPGWATMYRCQDPSGTTVLTDNPAQLKGCSQLETTVISAPIDPKTGIQPTPIPAPLPNTEHLLISSPDSSNQEHDQEHDIIIPLKNVGGSFVVQAQLNNERTAHLIVDTGASMTVLSTKIAIDLGILGTTDNELLTVNTAGGSVQVNMNYLTSLNIGTAQAQHVAIAIHDLPDIPEKIEGLLGMSFLKHFLVTLDAEQAKLILRPKPTS